jgi:hypothetical protein
MPPNTLSFKISNCIYGLEIYTILLKKKDGVHFKGNILLQLQFFTFAPTLMSHTAHT